jgi:hypothetical protein
MKTRKNSERAIRRANSQPLTYPKIACRCVKCGMRFTSQFHFDTLCSLCWADQPPLPFTGSVRTGRMVN